LILVPFVAKLDISKKKAAKHTK